MALQLRGDGGGRCQQGGVILEGRRSFLSSWSLPLKDSKSKCPGFAPHIHICIHINIHHVSTYETFYGRHAVSGLWQFFWNFLRIMSKIPGWGRSTVGIAMCLYVNSIIFCYCIIFLIFQGSCRRCEDGQQWRLMGLLGVRSAFVLSHLALGSRWSFGLAQCQTCQEGDTSVATDPDGNGDENEGSIYAKEWSGITMY